MTSDLELHYAIAAIQADYARCIDSDRLEDWPGFFTQDCLYKITTADNHAAGYEAAVVFANSRGMLVDRISALREANIYERHGYRHILGSPAILGREGGRVTSETPFLVVRIMRDGAMGVFACGRYLDIYDMGGARPALAERIVVCDSSRIDTLLAIPL